MQPGPRPEAIDTGVVFRWYALVAIMAGGFVSGWGPMWLTDYHFPGVPGGRAALFRLAGAIVVAAGVTALGFATVQEPLARRRGLSLFAAAHLVFGTMFLGQWIGVLDQTLPRAIAWLPLVAGAVLLYLAVTAPGSDLRRPLPTQGEGDRGGVNRFVVRNRQTGEALRSQYEEQIRRAVRHEERARLARDLHDAVKQQLFVIQTAAATAQTRFDTDASGAKTALDQVRSSAREAITEMDVMLEQLQAAPLENGGLVASLKRQCEALGFRTGARVDFDLGALPPDAALVPGARQAVFRTAQEALANVARHARAQHVRVSLGLIGGHLVLTVRDDGSGFVPGSNRDGMGMSNMAARASEVGGDLDIVSATGSGTTVSFSVPYSPGSSRAYAIRAAAWSVVLLATVVYIGSRGFNAQPWAAAIAGIAAIAVTRYSAATLRVHRGETPR